MNEQEIRRFIREELAKAGVKSDAAVEAWPVVGCYYWYIDADGDAMRTGWCCSEQDKFRQATGNVFKTEAEAEAHKAYLLDPDTVYQTRINQVLRSMNDWWEFEPGDNNYYILVDHDNKNVCVDRWYSHESFSTVYFMTHEQAAAAADAVLPIVKEWKGWE